MAELNGFGEKQLSYTDFIDNFVDKQTVADASIDGNANVGHKDIVSLENEMSKPHSKLLAFNKIYYELNKNMGFKLQMSGYVVNGRVNFTCMTVAALLINRIVLLMI